MKTIFLYISMALALTVFIKPEAHSQNALFLNQGNITFEKTTNVLAIMKDNMGDDNVWGAKMVEAYEKSNNPHSATQQFNLAFNGNKTLYTPIETDAPKNPMMDFMLSAGGNNQVYTNLDSSTSVAFKNIYDESFLVTDTLRNIRWKITDETRTIAGFQCRRANAIVMDSIYVVAFYTDLIPSSGGPESFTGLPGMILGLALPHKHMTWFATKVSVSPPVSSASLVPPAGKRKTQVITRKALYEKMQGRLGDWGKNGQLIIQNGML
ncbi:GLPGLI family protein [Arachidicoccus rhizosphaerae]|nr:GLPGLI family protein [Arachidicoccus rhizosphaerae]